MKYIPFNIKTDYYLLNSLIKIDELINFCVNNNVQVCAICDNNLGASFEFYQKCKKNNIKAVIGLEVDFEGNILYLYPENETGYKNLLKINTLMENNRLTEQQLIKYSNFITCILSYQSINIFTKVNFFENLFIGYTNDDEKLNALIISSNVIYNPDVKMFYKEDKVYLEYLNKLGGLNNLIKDNYLKEVKLDMQDEYNCFFSKINLSFNNTTKYIPKFNEHTDSFEYLKRLAKIGLEKRLAGISLERYDERLNYELEVIKDMGFTDYFLIVYDYVLYAKKNKILVGPGRGSAAGSLVCYAIGITDIDPIKYDLLFERFLNKDRITMPDIDIDFDSEKREEIINYVRNKYGSENVAVGLTYSTLKSKMILREISKIENINTDIFNKFINIIDRSKSLSENYKNNMVVKYLNTYSELKKVYKVSLKLENIKKNISTHAAGVVICSEALDNVIPIKLVNNNYSTGITMDYLEDLGILKMDFLGLKNLTIISKIINEIGEDVLKNIDLNDSKVIKLFTDAKTDSIFQYETPAMKRLLRKLKPKNFDEIVAAVALVRPGPSEFLDEYIYNKHNSEKIFYTDSRLKNILEETYGIILYQEQIIKIFVEIAGFTASEADLIRRSISKKKGDFIIESRAKFVKGSIDNGYKENEANLIYDKIIKFAGYGFNKSHSVAYAIIAFQMAYLKVYYEINFASVILNDNKDDVLAENFLIELKNKNIKIIKPDINFSKENFYIQNNNLILPFSMIKGVSKEVVTSILNGAPYSDFFDFILKNKDLKVNVIETLIKAGAFRSLKVNMSVLLNGINIAKNYADLKGYGPKPILPFVEELSEKQILKNELDIFGFYLGNHPASKYVNPKIMKLVNKERNLFNSITTVVLVEDIKVIKTKKNTDMAFLKVSDETQKDDFLVFSENLKYLENVNKNDLIIVDGKVSKSFDKISVIVNKIRKE